MIVVIFSLWCFLFRKESLKRLMKIVTSILATLFLIYLLVFPSAHGRGFLDTQHIKAQYIIHLTQFIDVKSDQNQTHICVIGDSDIAGVLNQIIEELNLIKELSVKTKTLVSKFTNCSFIYISAQSEFELEQILFKASDKKIVTISDIQNFISREGMIGFADDQGSIKLEINQTLIRQKNFFINSKLLHIARRVI